MPAAAQNAAFYFAAHNYRTAGDMVVGRQSASGGFLKGFIRHGGTDKICYYADTAANHADFEAFVGNAGGATDSVEAYSPITMDRLSEVGTLFRPGPALAPLAWSRRHFDPRAFSLVGITHTVSEAMALDVIGDLLIAPIEDWDALVCTSQCVHGVVTRVLEGWADYLEARFKARPDDIRLPIIPLGVDADALAHRGADQDARADLRRRMNIADDDIALLYAGRLDHVEKANPVPMLLAVEAAARATQTKLHLIQAGQASTPEIDNAFKKAATALAPSVSHHFIDGSMTELYDGAWAAADIFISLSDNIQESFGLTPIEAMAAGLPSVVSDWNGYRETVLDGQQGFTVPSFAPPPGVGEELGFLYGAGFSAYPAFTGAVSQSTAVDPAACSEALGKLIADKELRLKMGAAGQKRAADIFDWRHIIACHQALWAELADVRQSASERAPRADTAPAHPLRPDPFDAFQAHPSALIGGDATLSMTVQPDPGSLTALLGLELATPLAGMLLQADEAIELLTRISQKGPVSVDDLGADITPDRVAAYHMTLGWLAKMGFIRVSPSLDGPVQRRQAPFGQSSSWKDLAGG